MCVAVCCSVLQCVAVCCSVLQCVAVCYRVLQCVAVCCSVLQCVALCCSVLNREHSRSSFRISVWPCVAVCVAVCLLENIREALFRKVTIAPEVQTFAEIVAHRVADAGGKKRQQKQGHYFICHCPWNEKLC